jgi:hypothetical protein
MRRWKLFARSVSCSVVLAVGALAFTNLGCADDSFKCCQCAYACTDPASGATVSRCDCSTTYTYEDCGVYCEETLPGQLEAGGITGCAPPTTALAVDAC